jgi:chromosome segregation ATPase
MWLSILWGNMKSKTLLLVCMASLSLVGSGSRRGRGPKIVHGTTALARSAKAHADYNEGQIQDLQAWMKRQNELSEHRDKSQWDARSDSERAVCLAEGAARGSDENSTELKRLGILMARLSDEQGGISNGLEGVESDCSALNDRVAALEDIVEEQSSAIGGLRDQASTAKTLIDGLIVENSRFKRVLAGLVGGEERLAELMNPIQEKAESAQKKARPVKLKRTYCVGGIGRTVIAVPVLEQADQGNSSKRKVDSLGLKKTGKRRRGRNRGKK